LVETDDTIKIQKLISSIDKFEEQNIKNMSNQGLILNNYDEMLKREQFHSINIQTIKDSDDFIPDDSHRFQGLNKFPLRSAQISPRNSIALGDPLYSSNSQHSNHSSTSNKSDTHLKTTHKQISMTPQMQPTPLDKNSVPTQHR